MTSIDGEAVTITTMSEAKEVFRSKEMCQALYDRGDVVMNGVLVNLHGEAHRDRRRLENRLFRRETLQKYERDLFPGVIDCTLSPHVATGHAELVSLGHELMMNLAALNAGIDRRAQTLAETSRLYGYMMKFIEAATALHHVGDWSEASPQVVAALEAFDDEFLKPSIERRRSAIEAAEAGKIAAEEVPADVLSVLLRNEDQLHLPAELVRREVAFFLLAGAHTSATAFTRTIDNILTWCEMHPEDVGRGVTDSSWVQRCVHETVRLSPSSPIAMRRALADVTLRTGRSIAVGEKVVIDLVRINTDPTLFGADAEAFNPRRELPDGVAPHGISFGHGAHACIGEELAAGVVAGPGREASEYEWGLVTVGVQAALARGVARNPDDPPRMSTGTERPYWAAYPVVFASGIGRS